MTTWTCICLLGMSFSGEQQAIESFDFSTDQQARQRWHGSEGPAGTPLVRTTRDGPRRVLQLTAPFATQPQLERVFIDREVQLNLAATGEFALEIRTDAPDAAARLSLYFRSGKGWYAAGTALFESGWQSVRFSKSAFSIEGRPTGWQQIDAIRIAVWRGQPTDHAIRLRGLQAIQNDVALIVPSPGERSESRTASETAEYVGGMLRELGLGSDAIEEQSVASGALGRRQVAILAYTPGLSKEAIAGLVRYVEEGGKLLVCYQLPSQLGDVLGFTQPTYIRQQRDGQFAEVRFDAENVLELPASMRQASWNITAAHPSGYNARIVGHWFDQDGEPARQPALLVSDRGAFFSHILLPDDRLQKRRLLAAILGHLAPELWEKMATAALQRCGRVGHCHDYASLTSFLASVPAPEVADALQAARTARALAQQKLDAGEYPEVVKQAAIVHQQLVLAYLMAQPGKQREGRAFWNHTGTGAYPGDWDRTARELAAAGFNMLLPNMLWGGRAHYASDVLPRSATYQQHGDQIEQCVAACKKHGIEVHVWKVNWNLSGAPAQFVQKIHAEQRNQVSVDGQAHDWLCPSHPANQQLELDSMLEVARKYDVNGLHFDYIRYPDRDKCYCQGCRERFEAHRGSRVTGWPRSCHSGPLRSEYTQWRCDQITRLVKAVHDEAKQMRPDIQISAAVFAAYPSCRESVAQDWPEWIKAGYLDFVCPMDYTQSDAEFTKLVSNQLKLVAGRIPVYPGIGQWRLPEDRTVGQIFLARQLGAPGFTVFDLSAESIKSAVPAIQVGIGSVKAQSPHTAQ